MSIIEEQNAEGKNLERVKLTLDLYQEDTSLTENDKEIIKEYGFTNLMNSKSWNGEINKKEWKVDASMSYQQLKGFIRFLSQTKPYSDYYQFIDIEEDDDCYLWWKCYKCNFATVEVKCENCGRDYFVEKYKDYYIKKLKEEPQEVQDSHNIYCKSCWEIYVGSD